VRVKRKSNACRARRADIGRSRLELGGGQRDARGGAGASWRRERRARAWWRPSTVDATWSSGECVRMRLREVQAVLQHNLPRLNVETRSQTTPAGQPGFIVLNVSTVRDAVNRLAEIPGFIAEVGALKDEPLLKIPDGAVVDQASVSNLQSRIQVVVTGGGRLLDVLGRAVPPQDPLTLSVKLPPTYTLAELNDWIERLKQVLDDCARRVVNDGVRFSNFDSGSNWLELIAATKLVFWFVWGLLRVAQKYRLEELRALRAEETLKAMSTTGSHMEDVRKSIDDHLKLHLEAYAEEVRAERDAPKETVGHIMIAIENLSVLYARGAEVHRALGAPTADDQSDPEATKHTFPEHCALPESLVGPARQLAAAPTGEIDEPPIE
jgi:hypothetical protein